MGHISIDYFLFNGHKIPCNDKGKPVFPDSQRQKRRIIENYEDTLERQFLAEVNKDDFKPDYSSPYVWLCALFNSTAIPSDVCRSFAFFFSKLIKVPLPRECYRRKKCVIYWLQQNFIKITEFVQKNEIFISMNSAHYKIVYPLTHRYDKIPETLNLDQETYHDLNLTDIQLPSVGDSMMFDIINSFD